MEGSCGGEDGGKDVCYVDAQYHYSLYAYEAVAISLSGFIRLT